ncbi:MAG TPA: hypothetical protein VF746_03695 [Longimicrobium sp.]|jgi:hypothetical protein
MKRTLFSLLCAAAALALAPGAAGAQCDSKCFRIRQEDGDVYGCLGGLDQFTSCRLSPTSGSCTTAQCYSTLLTDADGAPLAAVRSCSKDGGKTVLVAFGGKQGRKTAAAAAARLAAERPPAGRSSPSRAEE